MKVYIAGVISKGGTLSESEIRANLRKFAEADLLLRMQGHSVYSPAHHVPDDDSFVASTNFEGWVHYMRTDIKALVDAEAIYPLSGWEESRGARLEVHIARELGLVELDRSSFSAEEKEEAEC